MQYSAISDMHTPGMSLKRSAPFRIVLLIQGSVYCAAHAHCSAMFSAHIYKITEIREGGVLYSTV
jgi:hypothetical protein